MSSNPPRLNRVHFGHFGEAVALGTILCLGACVHSGEAGGGPASETPHDTQASLGVPCPELQNRRDAPPTLLFVEAADITEAKKKESIGIGEPVAVAAVSNGLTTLGQASALPWHPCLGDACKDGADWRLLIESSATPEDSDLVSLNVSMRAGESSSPQVAIPKTPDQKTVLVEVRAPEGERELMLAITPYLLADKRDLATLLQCKQHSADLARASAGGATERHPSP